MLSGVLFSQLGAMQNPTESDTQNAARGLAPSAREVRPERGSYAVALLAAALATGTALCLFAARGIATPGVWHVPVLQSNSVYRVPLFTEWLAEVLSFLAIQDRLRAFSLIHCLIASLAAGVLAAIATSAVTWRASRWEVLICGWGAGLLFSAAGLWLSAATTGSPAVITVCLALAAYYIVLSGRKPLNSRALAVSALLIGLATANDPSFGVLAFLLLIAALGLAPENLPAGRIIVVFALGFSAAAGFPVLVAALRGETIAGFFSHALATPYPTPGDAMPRTGYLTELVALLPWPSLAASLLGLALLLRRESRGGLLVWALTFLTMGPFFPSLTNHTVSPSILNCGDGPRAMVLCAVVLFALWGTAAAVNLLMRKQRKGILAAACILLVSGILAAGQWRQLRDAP